MEDLFQITFPTFITIMIIKTMKRYYCIKYITLHLLEISVSFEFWCIFLKTWMSKELSYKISAQSRKYQDLQFFESGLNRMRIEFKRPPNHQNTFDGSILLLTGWAWNHWIWSHLKLMRTLWFLWKWSGSSMNKLLRWWDIIVVEIVDDEIVVVIVIVVDYYWRWWCLKMMIFVAVLRLLLRISFSFFNFLLLFLSLFFP